MSEIKDLSLEENKFLDFMFTKTTREGKVSTFESIKTVKQIKFNDEDEIGNNFFKIKAVTRDNIDRLRNQHYIQLRHKEKEVIAIDVDDISADKLSLLVDFFGFKPHIMINSAIKCNSYHIAFFLKPYTVHSVFSLVGTARLEDKQIQYNTIKQNLTLIFQGDLGYSGYLIKNPLSEKWSPTTIYNDIPLYELNDLRKILNYFYSYIGRERGDMIKMRSNILLKRKFIKMDQIEKFNPEILKEIEEDKTLSEDVKRVKKSIAKQNAIKGQGGRNSATFDALRFYAYDYVGRTREKNYEKIEKHLKNITSSGLIDEYKQDLPENEINHIIKSITKYSVKHANALIKNRDMYYAKKELAETINVDLDNVEKNPTKISTKKPSLYNNKQLIVKAQRCETMKCNKEFMDQIHNGNTISGEIVDNFKQLFGVSESTIYKYIKEIRQEINPNHKNASRNQNVSKGLKKALVTPEKCLNEWHDNYVFDILDEILNNLSFKNKKTSENAKDDTHFAFIPNWNDVGMGFDKTKRSTIVKDLKEKIQQQFFTIKTDKNGIITETPNQAYIDHVKKFFATDREFFSTKDIYNIEEEILTHIEKNKKQPDNFFLKKPHLAIALGSHVLKIAAHALIVANSNRKIDGFKNAFVPIENKIIQLFVKNQSNPMLGLQVSWFDFYTCSHEQLCEQVQQFDLLSQENQTAVSNFILNSEYWLYVNHMIELIAKYVWKNRNKISLYQYNNIEYNDIINWTNEEPILQLITNYLLSSYHCNQNGKQLCIMSLHKKAVEYMKNSKQAEIWKNLNQLCVKSNKLNAKEIQINVSDTTNVLNTLPNYVQNYINRYKHSIYDNSLFCYHNKIGINDITKHFIFNQMSESVCLKRYMFDNVLSQLKECIHIDIYNGLTKEINNKLISCKQIHQRKQIIDKSMWNKNSIVQSMYMYSNKEIKNMSFDIFMQKIINYNNIIVKNHHGFDNYEKLKSIEKSKHFEVPQYFNEDNKLLL